MTKYKFNLFARQLTWAIIWVVSYPEMFSFSKWREGSSDFLTGVLMYLISGFLLEALYRWFAWGQWYPPTKQLGAAVRPECPDHPWISILEGYPEPGVIVQLFCADGGERAGKSYVREDGIKGLAVVFSPEELELARSTEAWRLRPTHWRYFKDDPTNKHVSS